MFFVFIFGYIFFGYAILHIFRDYFWVHPGYTALSYLNTQLVSKMLTIQNLAFENYGT